MKKRYILSGASVLLSVGAYCLLKMKDKQSHDVSFKQSFEKAGRPDQLENVENEDMEQLENAKMVSEGSQFGVQYYNKTSKEEREALENNQ